MLKSKLDTLLEAITSVNFNTLGAGVIAPININPDLNAALVKATCILKGIEDLHEASSRDTWVKSLVERLNEGNNPKVLGWVLESIGKGSVSGNSLYLTLFARFILTYLTELEQASLVLISGDYFYGEWEGDYMVIESDELGYDTNNLMHPLTEQGFKDLCDEFKASPVFTALKSKLTKLV